MTWPSGDIALILGSASQIPANLPTRSPELIDQAVGNQIGDLARLANAIDANLEALPEGFLPLRELYAQLEKAKVPFALIVDGCCAWMSLNACAPNLASPRAEARTSYFMSVLRVEQKTAFPASARCRSM
jgi:hypothetical protein